MACGEVTNLLLILMICITIPRGEKNPLSFLLYFIITQNGLERDDIR